MTVDHAPSRSLRKFPRRSYCLPSDRYSILTPEGLANWRRLVTFLDRLSDDDADFVVRELDAVALASGNHSVRPFLRSRYAQQTENRVRATYRGDLTGRRRRQLEAAALLVAQGTSYEDAAQRTKYEAGGEALRKALARARSSGVPLAARRRKK